jgi:putative nucleotidyltransferase with HDIG domain
VFQFLVEKLKEHDINTYNHSLRVADLSLRISKKLSFEEHDQKVIYYGALLHDIGKLQIDYEILNKSEKLTKEEWLLIQQHTIFGHNLLGEHKISLPGLNYIVLLHHERLDGSGYPFGLKGDDIPIEVLIVGLADSYDAMTSQRPYSNVKTAEQALAELIRVKGIQFPSEIVEKLDDIIKSNL